MNVRQTLRTRNMRQTIRTITVHQTLRTRAMLHNFLTGKVFKKSLLEKRVNNPYYIHVIVNTYAQ